MGKPPPDRKSDRWIFMYAHYQWNDNPLMATYRNARTGRLAKKPYRTAPYQNNLSPVLKHKREIKQKLKGNTHG